MALLAALAVSAAQAAQWKLVDLGTLGGTSSSAGGINNSGLVVGCADGADSVSHAFAYQDGSKRDLGPGCAGAVNDLGVIAGHSATGELLEWKDGAVTHLGVQGSAIAINNNGAVLAVSNDGTTVRRFVYQDGAVTDLGFAASALNDAGQIAGSSNATAVLYQNGTVTSIAGGTNASGINNAGVIVGIGSNGQGPQPFLYDGTMHWIGATYSGGVGINNANQVIASAEGSYGYVIENGTSTSFSTLPDVVAAGWHHMEPADINDHGWIVGTGTTASGDSHAFLLVPVAASASRARVADFNGDGKGDLVVENADRSVDLLMMDGVAVGTSAHIVPTAPGHVIATTGDFNGDGTTDLLFRRDDGAVEMWIVNAGQVTPTPVMPAGAGWTVVHVGDFDGDGKSDLLWQNTNGAVGLWLMDGPNVKARATLMAAGSTWSPALAADLNGDGRTDIVWRNTDGSLSAWLMNGLDVQQRGPLLGPSTGWDVLQAGDFDGDGKADLVLQHTDGTTAIWLMNGLAAASKTSVMGANAMWTVARVADLDGDGNADLVWAARDGTVGAWLMASTAAKERKTLMPAGSGWSLAATTDANADGKSDLVWTASNGAVGAWMMNGTAVAARGPVALQDPSGRVVALQYQR